MKGQIALISLLGLGAFILLVGLSVSLSAFFLNKSNKIHKDGVVAFYAAESGAYDALSRIRQSSTFSSSGYNLNVGNVNAYITVEYNQPSVGQDRIKSTGTVGIVNRKVEVIITRASPFTIDSWQEIASGSP